MIVSKRFVVAGRVQGVGFRFFTEAQAMCEGLHGYVRNRSDGRVEVVVEGEADAVERLERAIHRGPPGARVDIVEVSELAPTGKASGFSIRP